MSDLDVRIVAPAHAEMLHRTAHELVRQPMPAGVPAKRVSYHPPAELAEALAEALRPPDRTLGCCVVRGLLSAFDTGVRTPAHWRDATGADPAPVDVAVLLLAEILGRPFGWTNQQDGRLVHDIVPSRGYEGQQVGASSTVPLTWHTEDAFHPARAGMLMLACIRNPDGLGTQVAAVRRLGLPAEVIAELGRPVVAILPDDSYPKSGWSGASARGMATIWADQDGPCLRYDPAYTTFLDADAAFREAYAELGRALDRGGDMIPLDVGDVAIVDNDVAVHGRRPFRARYDGTDRWLKRALVRVPRRRSAAEHDESGYGQEMVEPAYLSAAVR